MSDKEILKQIYLQALSNRQNILAADAPPAPQPKQEIAKQEFLNALPEGLTEREKVLHEVMGVYRQKRQMIDDLPPKHRMLLEKLSRLMLGVQDTKEAGKKH